jgi:Putative zinc-finger
MKCRDFHYLMDEYLDGELSDQLADEVILHKNECTACESHYNRRIQLFQTMKSSGDMPWSHDLVFQIMRDVKRKPLPKQSISYRFPVGIAVFLGVVVCFLIMSLGIGTIVDSSALREAMNAFVDIIGLPEEVQQGFVEIQGLLSGWMIAFKTLARFLSATMGPGSYVLITVLAAGITLGIGFWISRIRARRGHASY